MGDGWTRRDFVRQALGLAMISAASGAENAERATDYARAARVWDWLHHPVIGDPSFDTFVREKGNPIYVGSEPYWWPVNGTLFRDPVSRLWYAFVSVYPRGYFGKPGADIRILRETKPGVWEDMGLVFGDRVAPFVRLGGERGAATDGCVVYHDGKYHMLYGWANPPNNRGGLGYAWATRPEGPYHCADTPVDDDAGRKPVLGRYVRAYASTLIRRRNDWLILHMMSTPGNAGGTWGLFAMTSRHPAGPYGEPMPLLLPQSDVHHPPLAEFFPAYVVGDRVYAPATSVAMNRSYQALFSAPLERAEERQAWRTEQLGSLWHQEPVPWEGRGIWGQTFAASPAPGGVLRVLFPAKTVEDVGTISLARRRLDRPMRDGFVLAGPNGPAHAVLRRTYLDFDLDMEVEWLGGWHLAWGCGGPLGPDSPLADSRPHPWMRFSRTMLRISPDGWKLIHVNETGVPAEVGKGVAQRGWVRMPWQLRVRCNSGRLLVELNQDRLVEVRIPAEPGRIELVAESGGHLRVRRFSLRGQEDVYGETWLATEALAGAAAAPGEWEAVEEPAYHYGTGYHSAIKGARAKFNFEGRRCELFAPRGPRYGDGTVILDGTRRDTVRFHQDSAQPSGPVFAADLPPGRHALTLLADPGPVPCDCLRVYR